VIHPPLSPPQRWLKTRSACPLCNKEWEFAKIEKILAGGAMAVD
jgi:RING-box protein 1